MTRALATVLSFSAALVCLAGDAGPPRVDRFGDPLPGGALMRLGTGRFRLNYQIQQVVFSADGKAVAARDVNGMARVWDTDTGRDLLSPEGNYFALAFAPSGKTLALGSIAVELWDLSARQQARQFNAAVGLVSALAFSADGQRLASASFDNTVRIWDLAAGRELHQCPAGDAVHALAFSPDGRLLAAACEDHSVRLWDADAGKQVRRLVGHGGAVRAVAFAPRGRLLATGAADHTIRLWEADTGKALRTLDRQDGPVEAVAFSPDGASLAATGDGTIRLWDPATGRPLRRWKAHTFRVTSLAFAPDGKTLASSAVVDSAVHFWDPETGRELHADGHAGAVWDLAFDADGKSLTSRSGEKQLVRWDLATETRASGFGGPPVQGPVSISADRRLLATAGRVADSAVRVYDLTTGALVRTLGDHPGGVEAIAFAPDGKLLATGGKDLVIRLWDVAGCKLARSLEGHQGEAVMALAWSPDGTLLASASWENTSSIHFWDPATGGQLKTVVANGPVQVLAFSPDGRLLASGSEAGKPQLWDVAGGRERRELAGNEFGARALAFSPDGRLLATGCHHDPVPVHVWEVATGQEVRHYIGHHNQVCSLAFAPAGDTLASGGSDSTVLLWDLTGRHAPVGGPPATVTEATLPARWAELGGSDAVRAFQAAWDLAAAPERTVPFLRTRVRPAQPVGQRRLAELIAELDDDSFEIRERASHELAVLGPLAEAALRQALARPASLEVRRRLEHLLDVMDPGRNPEQVRLSRAIAALEHAGTPDARALLESLTRGSPEAAITQEAKTSLVRLTRRQLPQPPAKQPPG